MREKERKWKRKREKMGEKKRESGREKERKWERKREKVEEKKRENGREKERKWEREGRIEWGRKEAMKRKRH